MNQLSKTGGLMLLMLAVAACGGADSSIATADAPLVAWCMESQSSLEVCECADAALRASATPDDYDIYAGMAPVYLERRAAGEGIEPAFDAASEEALTRLDMNARELGQIANRIGRQHRQAINECGKR